MASYDWKFGIVKKKKTKQLNENRKFNSHHLFISYRVSLNEGVPPDRLHTCSIYYSSKYLTHG